MHLETFFIQILCQMKEKREDELSHLLLIIFCCLNKLTFTLPAGPL